MFAEDLDAAEREQGVQVREGDILLIRTGHPLRLAELGTWNTEEAKAGLHPTAMEFIGARGVAALGSDGNSDTAPSTTEGVDFPIHVLAITAMGIHLLDYLQFEDLRRQCELGGTVGVPVRGGAASDHRRHRFAAQPGGGVLMAAGYRSELTELAGFSACTLHDDTADLHATWLVGAGMLGASLVHRGAELLWQGAGPDAYAQERKFMGIPFLHPWANRLSGFGYSAGGRNVVLDRSSPLLHLDDNGLPIHGLLNASRDWSLREHGADKDRARLLATFDFDTARAARRVPVPPPRRDGDRPGARRRVGAHDGARDRRRRRAAGVRLPSLPPNSRRAAVRIRGVVPGSPPPAARRADDPHRRHRADRAAHRSDRRPHLGRRLRPHRPARAVRDPRRRGDDRGAVRRGLSGCAGVRTAGDRTTSASSR